MAIYIARHGQTDWNVQTRIQGRTDIELNETGINQAYQTREILLPEKIDLIITSPLKRAFKTANIINEGRDIPLVVEERVAERNFGKYEGMNFKDLTLDDTWNVRENSPIESAEGIRDFFLRIYGFLDFATKEYINKNILIVAHGGVSIPFDCYFNGIPESKFDMFGLILDNCKFRKYDYDESIFNAVRTLD